MKPIRLLALASLVLVGFAGVARAGTATSNMSVTATVSNSCTISAGALAFGAYNTVAGSAVDASGTITVACTKGSSNTVTLGQGSNANTGSTDAAPLRRLKDTGTNYLSYSLYQDSGRTTAWANTAGTGLGYSAASSASSNLTVYGRISASQDGPAGSYSDTVVATITY